MRRLGGSGVASLAALVAFCLVGVVTWLSWSAVGSRGGSGGPVAVASASTAPGSPRSPSLSSLVVPGVQLLDDGQQVADQAEAAHASPRAAFARAASQTAYRGLGVAAASRLARQAFPEAVASPSGGLASSLPAGDRVVRYLGPTAAQIELPGGRHAAVESLEPIATRDASGGYGPIDLSLHATATSFQPAASDAPTVIPKHLQDGVSLADSGVSLTPVDSQGKPLSGAEGQVDGASVFYGGTGTDTDTLAKPTATGFEEDTLLRSTDSPRQLYFRVALPEGTSLVSDGSGGVSVVRDGHEIIASIPAPSAQDAGGTSVPVAMSVAGDTISLTVSNQGGSNAGEDAYRYPIAVDPVAIDNEIKTGTSHNNWGSEVNGSAFTVKGSVIEYNDHPYENGQSGYLAYHTQGESHIVKFFAKGSSSNPPAIRATVDLVVKESEKREAQEFVSGSWEETLCSESCQETTVNSANQENRAHLIVSATETGNTSFVDNLQAADVYILQTAAPEVEFDKLATLGEKPNASSGVWMNTKSAVLGFGAIDRGVGIYAEGIRSPNKPEWGFAPRNESANECAGKVQCTECYKNECKAGPGPLTFSFAELGELPEGEDTVETTVQNAMGLSATAKGTVRVDNAPPHSLILNGLPSNDQIGAGEYHLTAEATDGSGNTPSSGIASIALLVDGRATGNPTGSCAPGPCTAHSGEWTIAGRNYAPGRHIFTIVATDSAGNVERSEIVVTVHSPSPVSLGPGSVNPESGEYMLSATDVSLGNGLTVSRSYDSRHVGAGGEGPFGPAWGVALGGQESLTEQANGSMVLTTETGIQLMFAKEKEGYVAPPGDGNLSLSTTPCEVGATEFMLKNAATNTTTCFKVPPGGNGELWMPNIAKGAVATETVTYSYETTTVGNVITRPREAIAPVPAKVSCSPTPERGCRILTFVYATTTSAAGENSNEWGQYKGRLSEIVYTAYSPSAKEMKKVPVAEYVYDAKGRLRAEWDPRVPVSKPERTTYGYDAEGQVTALTPPGQESWAFVYGSTVGDPSIGRLIKVSRAPAGTGLWQGKAPEVTAAPQLSGTPSLGDSVSVSRGAWANEPVAYGYQWGDCSPTGECTPIPGATNPSYTVTRGDEGYTVTAFVTATNGGGSVTTSAGASVIGEQPTYESAFGSEGTGNGQFKGPTGVATDPSGNVWVVDIYNSRVEEFSSEGTFIRSVGSAGTGNGQFTYPRAVAIDSKGNVWVSDTDLSGSRLEEFTSEGVYQRTISSSQLAGPEGLTVDSQGNVWVADLAKNDVVEFSPEGTYMRTIGSYGSGNGQLNGPAGVAVDSAGNVWVVDSDNNRVEEFNATGSYVRQCGSAGSGNLQFNLPSRILLGPENRLWIGDSGNNRVQILSLSCTYITQFGATGKSEGQFSTSGAVAVYGSNVYVADIGDDRVERWSSPQMTPPTYTGQFGSQGSGNGQLNHPWGLATDQSGNVWVTDTGNNRVEEFNSSGGFVRSVGSVGTGNGQFKSPEAITVDSKGDIWVADSHNNRVQELNSEGQYLKTVGSAGTGNGQFSQPEGLTVTPSGDLFVADHLNNRVEEFNSEGAYLTSIGYAGTGNGQLEGPGDVAVDSYGDIWVADTGNDRIEEFNARGEYMTACGTKGMGDLQFRSPWRMTFGPEKNLWVADSVNNRVQVISPQCTYLMQFAVEEHQGGEFKYTGGVGIYGSNVYVLDFEHSRVDHWTLPAPGEQGTPTAGSTIEYNVPVWGSGAPHNMSPGEVERWAQKDHPAEATAIFPPDSPQGWPAGEYKRATIYYLDANSHLVNVASPSGGISTSEYNATDDVVRTLSPRNRLTALEYGSQSAATSEKLDMQSKYNGEGTELESTLGPQHKVKLPNGKEVLARDHIVYSYNENAPSEGGPYRLVTQETQGAQIEGEAEQDVRTTRMLYSNSAQGNLGWTFRRPLSVISDAAGAKLMHSVVLDPATGNVKEESQPAGEGKLFSDAKSIGGAGNGGKGKFLRIRSVAVAPNGDLYALDSGEQLVEEFSPTGEFLTQFGGTGSGNGQFKSPYALTVDSHGNVWVADTTNHRVQEFNESGKYVAQFGSSGTGNGQFQEPEGVAVDAKGDIYVADASLNRVQEFNSELKYVAQFGTTGSGSEQFKSPGNIAIGSNGDIYVADTGNNRIEVFNEERKYVTQLTGSGTNKLKGPVGVAVDANGNVYVADTTDARVEIFNSSYAYLGAFGSSGSEQNEFERPVELAITPTATVLDVADVSQDRIDEWTAGTPHQTRTIYYSAEANASYPSCGKHAEWANFVCQTEPAKQPATSGGLPALPVTTYEYNMWGEPVLVISKSGTATRTTKNTYDEAGRMTASETTSSVGTALPPVAYKYEESTGLSSEASTTVEGKTQSIKATYNTLGQLASYTDAEGALTQYEYETEKDARLKKVSDPKGSQTYLYNETTGLLTELQDSAAPGTYTAGYDVEGNLVEEGYPNGLKAIYTYNPTGQPVGLQYKKTGNCTEEVSEKCVWFKESVVPSVHGQWISRTNSFGKNTYSYDGVGRLTQVQEEPTGQGCTTRAYTYDEDTNRTGFVVRGPGGKGECTSEGGTVSTHAYDEADRLTDAGTSYDEYGNTTSLPAADAGGSTLTSSFYVNDMLASQTQAGETIGYNLDPIRRTREIVSTGKVVATTTNHYDGPGETPAWTGELSGQWSRNINGIGGNLVAIQHNGETPILQLANLHGDIVATVEDSEAATGLKSTIKEASEYGVPATLAPPKYAWLGAHELPTELPSGVVAMGVRSYVPEIGRFLQTDPAGAGNAYAYTEGDPVNSFDYSGEYSIKLDALDAQVARSVGQEQTEIREAEVRREAEEAAARAEAERKARESSVYSGFEQGGSGEEWGEEEWGEEWGEEEWEYAAYHAESSHGQEKAQLEEGLAWRPFGEEASEGGGEEAGGDAPRCEAGHSGPCVRVVARCNGRSGQCHGGGNRRSRSHGKTAEDICGMAETVTKKSICSPANPEPNNGESVAKEFSGAGKAADPNAPGEGQPPGGAGCPRDQNACRVG